MTVIAKHTVRYNGKVYPPGAPLPDMRPEQLAGLRRVDAVEEAAGEVADGAASQADRDAAIIAAVAGLPDDAKNKDGSPKVAAVAAVVGFATTAKEIAAALAGAEKE
ncbi:MAG: hypothetical protein AB7E47_12850 [Desulfovibrionaceae bacterium]